MEVGLGGRYDATNVLRKPVVCGISHLGLEHTRILGNTVGEIAYHKAGIFKPGVQAFTSPQVSEAMDSLMACSKEVQVSINVCYSGLISCRCLWPASQTWTRTRI